MVLVNAMNRVFPNAIRYLCTKHLKDNVCDYLINNVGIFESDRTTIIRKIFGPNGLVQTTDRDAYEDKVKSILDDYSSVYQKFAAYMDGQLTNILRKHVTEPMMTQSNNNVWTNNN